MDFRIPNLVLSHMEKYMGKRIAVIQAKAYIALILGLLISIYHAILELLRSAPAVLCAESLIASRIYLIVPSSKLNEL